MANYQNQHITATQPVKETGQPIQVADPLDLKIPDEELVRIIDKRIEDSQRFFKSINLYDRRRKNETYLLGRQVKEKEKLNKLKTYEARVLDNALYEIEQSLKPVVMGTMPDMIVYDPENGGKTETSEDVSQFVNDKIRRRNTRQVLSMAFRHHPVYYTGVIKVRWSSEKNDFVYECVHPDNIEVDYTATVNDADKMSFICQKIPMTVQDMFMRFPNKKKEIIEELSRNGIANEKTPEWKMLASKVYVQEVWFTSYEKKESPEMEDPDKRIEEPVMLEPGDKWDRVDGVLWKYGTCILKKMKDPNFDHVGEQKMYTYLDPAIEESKTELSEEQVMQAMATGVMPDVSMETIYHNHFQKPRKPFYFIGYDQWGKQPFDETSRVEQNIYNQENLDRRGKQINDTLSNRGKHIWSKDGGLDAGIIERMDMANPEQDALVEGDVTRVHKFIAPERPTRDEFGDLNATRERMFSLAGATNLTGQLQSDTATSNQIAQNANFTRADDLAEETINSACEWMAEWALQMIKLRYTKEHFTRVLGKDGLDTFIKISRDSLSDGMEVAIKSSSTDKLKTQRRAMEMVGVNMIDPLTLFEDLDLPDPKGRAEKLITFQADPVGYFTKYIQEMPIMPPTPDIMAQQPLPPGQEGAPQTPSPTAPEVTAEPVTDQVQADPSNGML